VHNRSTSASATSVEDTVARLKDGHLRKKITHLMDTRSQEFYKKVNNLEDVVARIKEEEQKVDLLAIIFNRICCLNNIIITNP
jgi:thymidylate synthase